MGLGQGEQPVDPQTQGNIENEIAPVQEDNQLVIENQNNQPIEQPVNTENTIQPEEIPNIDESIDTNEIEPVGLENIEAKGKVLTRRI